MLNGIINRGSTAVNTSGTNLTVDSDAIFASASGNNIAIGENALNSTDTSAVRNIAIGKDSGTVITNGDDNTLIGYQAGDLIAGHSDNVAVGSGSLQGVIESAVAIGYQALGDASLDANANGSVAVGYRALYALEGGQENTAIGYSAMVGHTTGSRNTAVGYAAMDGSGGATVLGSIDNTFIGRNSGGGTWTTSTSDYNVAVGNNTLDAAMNGAQENTVVGHNAGSGIIGGDGNVLLGSGSGFAISSGSYNIGVGKDSLLAATANSGNIAIGYQALLTIDNGENYNVAIGHGAQSLVDNDTADYNIGIGYQALEGGGSTGNHNTVIGSLAGDAGSNAADNLVIIGAQAGRGDLHANADGTVLIGKSAGAALTEPDANGANIAIGYAAMNVHTTGSRNVAIGYEAMHDTNADSDSMGSNDNVFLGYSAGGGEWAAGESSHNIGIGSYVLNSALENSVGNIGIGQEALNDMTTGDYNVCIGYNSGDKLTTHSKNVAVGGHTLGELGADYNVAIGYEAGKACEADNNTLVGYQAGDSISTGQQNTGIGASVAFDIDANNQTCVGYQATTDSANDIAIGNTSVDEIEAQVSIGTYSDKRIKKNIKDNDLGLDFINLLKPRKFNKVDPAKYPKSIKNKFDGVGHTWTKEQDEKVWDGLIAQEVKEAMDICKTSYSGWREKKNSKQVIEYDALVVPLIKAVQELSQQIEDLKKG